jgi:hypothetical protein
LSNFRLQLDSDRLKPDVDRDQLVEFRLQLDSDRL